MEIERNSHKVIIICIASFELPSTFPQKRYLPCVSRSASWRAAAALFKIPSRAAASHDSLTIRVICNSFLVVLAPTSAVRNVFLLRRWWPLHTDLDRVENSSLSLFLSRFSPRIPSLSPSFFSLFLESERREREREGKKFTIGGGGLVVGDGGANSRRFRERGSKARCPPALLFISNPALSSRLLSFQGLVAPFNWTDRHCDSLGVRPFVGFKLIRGGLSNGPWKIALYNLVLYELLLFPSLCVCVNL